MTASPQTHDWRPQHTDAVRIDLSAGEITLRFAAHAWPRSRTPARDAMLRLFRDELATLPEVQALRAAQQARATVPSTPASFYQERPVGSVTVQYGDRQAADAAVAEAREKALAAITARLRSLPIGDGRTLLQLAEEAASKLQELLSMMAATRIREERSHALQYGSEEFAAEILAALV